MLWTMFSVAFAQTAAGAPAAKPGIGEMLLPFVAIMVIFYFLMARPQQKKMKEHQSFLTALKRGDHILTTSGIYGEIAGLTDQYVTLQIADNVKIKLLKSQVARLAKEEAKT